MSALPFPPCESSFSRLGFFRLLSDAPANPRAVGHPLDMTAFVSVPSTNLELLECLQLSANAVVRTLALELLNAVGEALPPATDSATVLTAGSIL